MAEHSGNESEADETLSNDTQASTPVLEPPMYVLVYFTGLAVLVFLVGAIGNMLVILVVCRIRSMRTRMNYFLVSLSLADLLVLIVCEPTAIMTLYTKDVWLLGEAMCKIVPFMENATLHSSVLSLVSISIERYIAICHPFRQQRRGKARTDLATICLSWGVSLLLATPFAMQSELQLAPYHDDSVQTVCSTTTRDRGMKIFIIVHFVFAMMLPLCLLTSLYTIIILRISNTSCACVNPVKQEEVHGGVLAQNRKQVIWMMVAVVVLFYVCLLPMRAVSFWTVFSSPENQERLGFVNTLNLHNVARLLTFVNSAGNPIIYALLSTKFRKAFRMMMPSCSREVAVSRASTPRSSRLVLRTYNTSCNSQSLQCSPHRDSNDQHKQSLNFAHDPNKQQLVGQKDSEIML